MLAAVGCLAAMLIGVVTLAVAALRERWTWRRRADDAPFVPSRVYIDERYGSTDADATRMTGYLGPSATDVYAGVLGASGTVVAWQQRHRARAARWRVR